MPTLRNRIFPGAIFTALALGFGCTDSTAPDLESIMYTVKAGCIPVPYFGSTCEQKTTVARGDTLILYHAVWKTIDGDPTTIKVHTQCGTNFEIRHGWTLAAVLPRPSFCGVDTVETRTEINEGRGYLWIVPADAPVGEYSIRSTFLVDPPVSHYLRVTVK